MVENAILPVNFMFPMYAIGSPEMSLDFVVSSCGFLDNTQMHACFISGAAS